MTANFTQLYYTFNVAAGSNGAIGGTADGSSIAYGAGFTVTATPDTGYEFVNWTDGTGTEVSTNVTYSTTMPAGNLSLTANFTVKSFDFTVAAGTGGSIAPGSTTDGSLPYGTDFSVTATADPGYRFVNWTDDTGVVSTNDSYTVVPSGNLALTANFTPVYEFTKSVGLGGVTNASTPNGQYVAGTSPLGVLRASSIVPPVAADLTKDTNWVKFAVTVRS
ncbi:hypothetical protein AGMMS50218_18160 [Actinomycetota bacterium]|nr:hypothetical protein AGMMS50218_18160 [Actinomycetota bacterium]